MNNEVIIRKLFVLLFLSLHLGSFAFNVEMDTDHYGDRDALEQRINNISSHVDLRLSKESLRCIENYTTRHRKGSESLLGRVAMYFPYIENELKENNLPQELKYLAIVESSLKASATSNAGAAGLWQFMRGTGKMYGLKINSTVDERKDPLRSTNAALEYLSDLYEQFDDWTLALAAYNCGPGNVRKAMRRSGKRSFWEIEKYLPKETRKYIPRFVAASYIMNYYHDHDLVPEMPEDEFRFTATAKVSETLKFSGLSKEIGLTLDKIKTLNPAYLKNYIPNHSNEYYLTLPESKMYEFLGNRNQLDQLVYSFSNQSNAASVAIRRLRKMDAVQELPGRFEFQPTILEHNPIHSKIRMTPINNQSFLDDTQDVYQLRKGESIFDIAAKHEGVSVEDILSWNNLSITTPPKQGDLIVVKK